MAVMDTICIKCHVKYGVLHVGATVCYMAGDPPRPYELWGCDVVQCPGCGHAVLTRFADKAFAHSFDDDFVDVLEKIDRDWFIEIYEQPIQYKIAGDFGFVAEEDIPSGVSVYCAHLLRDFVKEQEDEFAKFRFISDVSGWQTKYICPGIIGGSHNYVDHIADGRVIGKRCSVCGQAKPK